MKLLKLMLEYFLGLFCASFALYCVISFFGLVALGDSYNANAFEWVLGLQIFYFGLVFIFFVVALIGFIDDFGCYLERFWYGRE